MPRFNIKMSSYQYRKSHCGDKMVVRLSYLHNGISYTGKMSSLYWIGALAAIRQSILYHQLNLHFLVSGQSIFKNILTSSKESHQRIYFNKILFYTTEKYVSSFWWNFHHFLHTKLSKWQLPVQPVMEISWRWQCFCFSDIDDLITS